ncbi:hypothetical protein [Myxococcus sp. RHSTA-1-4]|nr:hypothetical protein [Myxococcus sp. RHSTA-1-4]
MSGRFAAFDAMWQERRLLRGLDVDAARVLIQGQLHARVGRAA